MAAGVNNSLDITSLIPKFGPGRAGFAVKRSDKRVYFDVDGTQRPLNFDNVITVTADRVLLARESGSTVIVDAAGSKIVTLPAAARGLSFTIFTKQVPGSGVGVLVKVTGNASKIYSKVSAVGAAIAESAGKGVVNTQGTAIKGDQVRVSSDGTDWFAEPVGIWAREA